MTSHSDIQRKTVWKVIPVKKGCSGRTGLKPGEALCTGLAPCRVCFSSAYPRTERLAWSFSCPVSPGQACTRKHAAQCENFARKSGFHWMSLTSFFHICWHFFSLFTVFDCLRRPFPPLWLSLWWVSRCFVVLKGSEFEPPASLRQEKMSLC